MEFPIYLKFINNKHFFKIRSFDKFEEVSKVGKQYFLFSFEAKIYPDKLKIIEMIENKNSKWIAIDEQEFLCKKKKTA